MVTQAVAVSRHRATRVLVAVLISLMGLALTRCAPARVWVVSGDPVGPVGIEGTAINIQDINAAFLPGILGDPVNDPARAERLCDDILSGSADVVCMQEVFDEGIRKIISKRLAERYPHRLEKGDGGFILKQDSGLFIASRYPFVPGSVVYEPFTATGPLTTADAWAAKGILGVYLDLSSIEPGLALGVFTTHLQADYEYSGEYAKVRELQLEQIRGVIDSTARQVARQYRAAVILTGDLNVPGDTAPDSEYGRMLEILRRPTDLAPGHNTWDPSRNGLAEADDDGARQLDYILGMDAWASPGSEGAPAPRISTDRVEMQVPVSPELALSDHFALLIRCVLV